MKFFKSLFFLLILFLTFAPISEASSKSSPVITVINPIRELGLQMGKGDALASLKSQWQVTHDLGISATWLWQYSTLEDKKIVDLAKSQMHNQEFGLFLEIDRNLAKEAGVQYRGQGPWYFSDGLLLVSYDQTERKRLIDTAFSKFKSTFGYYPKSAGAWWVGADSIDYMQEKYGIVSSLRAADQFDLDVYSIWGTPWSIPYVSSKENSGIPGNSWEDSSKVVIMQWAARDPLRGYGPSSENGTYSIQDYGLKGYELSFFNYLSSIYLKKPHDQMVVGLESDLPSGSYQGSYKDKLSLVSQWNKNGKVKIMLAKDYAEEFLSQHKILPPTNYFLTKDFRSEDQSFWFNSVNFRAGIEKIRDEIFLIDLRNYSNAGFEDFAQLPNSQGYLRISEPAIIDSARFPDKKILIGKSNQSLQIKENNGNVTLLAGRSKIAFFTSEKFELYDFKTQSFNFTPKKSFTEISLVLLIIFISYSLFVFWRTKNLFKTVINTSTFLIPLLLAYPFLSYGQTNNLAFFFDRKELILFHLPVVPKLSPYLLVILIFQIIPFFLLLISNYILVFLLRCRQYKLVYLSLLGFLILLYAHTFYFPLDRSTFTVVVTVLSGFAFILFLVIAFIFYQKRSIKIFITSFICVSLFLGLVTSAVIFSRQKYIITPFEMEALIMIEKKHKNILFIYPDQKPIYKAVRPLLYDFFQFGGKLTGTYWKKITRDSHGRIQLNSLDNSWLFVPRYLGANLSANEINNSHLVEVFDNAQIAIYKKK